MCSFDIFVLHLIVIFIETQPHTVQIFYLKVKISVNNSVCLVENICLL